MDLELLVGLLTGPAAGVGVSIFFLKTFISYQKDVTNKLIAEIREDSKIFEATIVKIDSRVSYHETLIESIIK
jgi:hypothetical protein